MQRTDKIIKKKGDDVHKNQVVVRKMLRKSIMIRIGHKEEGASRLLEFVS